ncbi:MAG: hypothetical protein DUD34_14640 [Lactobacillus sp.]|nr:MAG: hypothetical protein DUD34_14640 [Lactobacillus sp.]
MNLKKQLGLSLVVGGGLLFGLSTPQTTAHASTYLRYYENIPNKTVSVTNKNAYVYNNGRLSRKMGTMRYYGSKVEEYYAAHVVKNGKASIYYKFRVGHRTGWVWHGYLKSIASSTGTTPTTTPTNTTTTTPTSGATTPTNTTAGGKSIAPGTTVDNMDWTKLEQQRYVDVTPSSAYLMSLFPGTIYNQKVQNAAKLSWASDDSAGFDYGNSAQGYQRFLSAENINTKGYVAIYFNGIQPYDHASIDKALTKVGYDANARSKFAGWSIGAEYNEPGSLNEGVGDGDGLILLVPNP